MKFIEKFQTTQHWKTKVRVVALYHNLKLLQNPNWTVRGTANYFKISMGAASENLLISRNLTKLDGCTSRNKALKILRNK